MAIRSFPEIIELWPSTLELAEDLRLPYSRVRKWKQRKRIPDEHWAALLKAADKRGFRIEASHLVAIAGQER